MNADAPWIYKIYYMKYPDTNIQIKYPNKLINADTPSEDNALKMMLCEVKWFKKTISYESFSILPIWIIQQLPRHLRLYLPLFVDVLEEADVERDGTVTAYKTFRKELTNQTVNLEISLSKRYLCLEFSVWDCQIVLRCWNSHL